MKHLVRKKSHKPSLKENSKIKMPLFLQKILNKIKAGLLFALILQVQIRKDKSLLRILIFNNPQMSKDKNYLIQNPQALI